MRLRWHLLLLPLAALAATAPLMMHGASCGHDFDFHIDNWIEVAQQWRHGIVWPHWDVSANFGAGEPRFVFYPPLSWMLGAVLGIVFGWNAAAAAYVFVALSGAAASMYLLAREYAGQRAAVIAAALYATNPYIIFVVYERGAYAELLAAAWMPLVVLYTLRRKVDPRPLAVVIALCWLTNGPAGVMATYVALLLLLFRLIGDREWRNTLRGCAGVALGIALSAFYLVPVVVERRWIQIENALVGDTNPDASYLFGHVGSALHLEVLHSASWLAVILFVTAAVAYGFAGRSANRLALPAILLGVLLLVLLPISAFAWHHAPELAFLQFPWRFLLIVGVLAAIGVAVALSRARKFAWAALLLVVVSVGFTEPKFRQNCDEEDAVSGQIEALSSGDGVEGSDEYSPNNSDNSHLANGMPYAWLAADANAAPPKRQDGARISVREWSTEKRRLLVRADRTEYLVVRLMDFPAWKLRVNDHDTSSAKIQQRDDGLMAMTVPTGVSNIDLVYREPGDMWIGRAISLITLLVLLLMSFWRVRGRRAVSQ